MRRVRDNHIRTALRDLNTLRGLKYPDAGYVYYADVVGDGVYRPKCYVVVNANGGVSIAYGLQGLTRRATLGNIQLALDLEQTKQKELQNANE